MRGNQLGGKLAAIINWLGLSGSCPVLVSSMTFVRLGV
jgi:hypothetical protein